MRLKDKIVLITGSTQGVGRQTAVTFASEGARVLVTGRTQHLGKEVVEEIRAAGGEAEYLPTDVGREEDVAGAVEYAVEKFGGLTTLINNAAPTDLMMNSIDNEVTQLTTENWDRIMKLTLTSVFWGLKYAIPHLLAAGSSSVINISSVASLSGAAGIDAYTAAKGGLISLTRSIAVEYGAGGLRSNCLVLGFVPGETSAMAQNPVLSPIFHNSQLVPRFGRPADVASAATWLASDESVFVTGTVIPIDGGMMAKSNIPDLRAHFPDMADERAIPAS
jgi:NAD(P)-dependent dehydrogenase (short-subunit alcohol dehydrogenase family)